MKSVLDHAETFAFNPFTNFAVAIVLTVVAWRLTEQGAQVLLTLAWGFATLAIFRMVPIHAGPLIPRLLWTMLGSSVIGLLLVALSGLLSKSGTEHSLPVANTPFATSGASSVAGTTPPLREQRFKPDKPKEGSIQPGHRTESDRPSKPERPQVTQAMVNSPGGIQAAGNIVINEVARPWKLTESQREVLTRNASGHSAIVNIITTMNLPDSTSFADSVRTALLAAGWEVDGVPIIAATSPFRGVIIEVSHADFPEAAILQNTLVSFGIPSQGLVNPSGGNARAIQLHVGSRP